VEKKTGRSPVDRGKIGTKRSLVTDRNGIPISCPVAGANKNDFKILEESLEHIFKTKDAKNQSMCLDKGYDYSEVRIILKKFNFIPHIHTRGEEKIIKRTEGKSPKRWPVERTHSWMNRFRGMLIRWCKKAENYQSQVYLVCAYITMCQCGLLG
jgi:transposase